MKKNLDDIREELETELDTAQGLSEIMLLIHTGARCFEREEITFENVKNAFYLLAQLFEEHARNLDAIADKLVDFDNDLKIK